METIAVASVAELHRRQPGPFVRYRLTESTVRTVWRLGDAAVVDQSHDRHGEPVSTPVLFCLGDADQLRPLLAEVARRLPAHPAFVSVEAHAEGALPAGWEFAQANRWDSMWSDTSPAGVPGEERVEELSDIGEINALLDRANPNTHGRPGDRGMRAWVGVRDDAGLLAVGALSEVVGTGVAHLRGVSTLPPARGRGLGTAVSARLTRMGLETMSTVVTLGVYTSNAAARSIYQRLGYRHDRSFVSGPLRACSAAP